MRSLKAGSTSVIIDDLFIADTSSSIGAGLTGLAFGTSGLTCYYHRNTANASAAVTLATMTLGTWATGGFKEVDSTHMPGVYSFCPPDAAIAAGAQSVTFYFQGATNMLPTPMTVELLAVDPQDTIRGGMTAIPSVASGSAGAIPTTGTGANQIAVNGSGSVSHVVLTDTASVLTTLTAVPTDWLTAAGVKADAVTKIQSGLSTYAGGAVSSVTGNVGGNVTGSVGSVVGAVGSVTGAVGSVTGNVGGNVVGTVTLATSQPNYAPSKAGDAMALTSGERTMLTGVIWAALTSGLTTAGSVGKKLADWVLGTDHKALLSTDAQTGVVLPRVTLVDTTSALTGYAVPPTAAQNATAFWQDVTGSDFTVTGSPGKFVMSQLAGAFTGTTSVFTTAALANAPSGGGGGGGIVTGYATGQDPATLLAVAATGGASGTWGAAMARIGSAQVSVTYTVDQTGLVRLIQNCDYFAADGAAQDFTDQGGTWPNLTGATRIFMEIFSGPNVFIKELALLTHGVAHQSVRWEPTAADDTDEVYSGSYVIRATLANTHTVPLETGEIRVIQS